MKKTETITDIGSLLKISKKSLGGSSTLGAAHLMG
jgi:hypothetical protein